MGRDRREREGGCTSEELAESNRILRMAAQIDADKNRRQIMPSLLCITQRLACPLAVEKAAFKTGPMGVLPAKSSQAARVFLVLIVIFRRSFDWSFGALSPAAVLHRIALAL